MREEQHLDRDSEPSVKCNNHDKKHSRRFCVGGRDDRVARRSISQIPYVCSSEGRQR